MILNIKQILVKQVILASHSSLIVTLKKSKMPPPVWKKRKLGRKCSAFQSSDLCFLPPFLLPSLSLSFFSFFLVCIFYLIFKDLIYSYDLTTETIMAFK